MKKYSFVLILVSMILYSCHNESSSEDLKRPLFIEDNSIINDSLNALKLPLVKGGMHFDNIIDSVWYVPLSTISDSSLIHRINEIKFFENNIYIADYKQNCLFKFSGDGSFIKRLKQKGEGPLDYKRLSSFEIDTVNRKICLLDGDLGRILMYNLSFEHDSTFKLPINNVDHISLYKDKYMFLELGFRHFEKSGISPNLVLYDIERNRIVKDFFRFKNEDIRYHTRNDFAFSNFQGKLYYWTALGNKIYECNDSALKSYALFDLGRYQVPLLATFKKRQKEALNFLVENRFAYIDSFFEMDNWIYARVSRKTSAVHYFYNKKNKETFVDVSINSSKIENTILPQLFKVSDTILCGCLPAERYLYIDESYNAESNPVLVFYKLKQ